MRMRSISASACFISSIDSWYSTLAELLQAPLAVHAGVQEILVDGGELARELAVQDLDDLLVALHARSRWIDPLGEF